MQPVRPPLLRKDTEDLVRESIDSIQRLKQRQDGIYRAIAGSKARLADTRDLLQRMDVALARLNIKL